MLDHSEIRSLLPHGHPMILVDRVDELEPNVSITAVKAISGCEPCYRELPRDLDGSRYAFPTSLLVESFGQAAALLWMSSTEAPVADPERVLMFTAARSCQIEGRAFPGDVVRHVARIDHLMEEAVFVEGEIFVAGEDPAGERRIATIQSMMAVSRPCTAIEQATTRKDPEEDTVTGRGEETQ